MIQLLTDTKATKLTLCSCYIPISLPRSVVSLVHLVACVTKTIWRTPRGTFLNSYCDFQRLQNSDLMLKFIYHTILALFYSLDLLIAAKSKFLWAFIKRKWGEVARTLSLPPVRNFCPQTSVDIWSLSLLIHCLRMRAHE